MKTLIWALPTRLFHWLLAISFAFAYILGHFDDFIRFHFAFGALIGTLVGLGASVATGVVDMIAKGQARHFTPPAKRAEISRPQ